MDWYKRRKGHTHYPVPGNFTVGKRVSQIVLKCNVLGCGPHGKSSVDTFKFVTSVGILKVRSKGSFFVYPETIVKAGLSCSK
jgi:hypothetical protein